MKIVTVHLKSTAPYSQSRMHDAPKNDKESHDDYERRTWREKCTTDIDGQICIPAMGFKQALDAVAKLLGMKTTGKGTFTKHFVAGCICEDDVPLGVFKNDVAGVTINANSDGVRGSGKRVKRTFPLIPSWEGKLGS